MKIVVIIEMVFGCPGSVLLVLPNCSLSQCRFFFVFFFSFLPKGGGERKRKLYRLLGWGWGGGGGIRICGQSMRQTREIWGHALLGILILDLLLDAI